MAKSAFILAATQSGSGKTTFSMGLMAALRSQGHTVQPFKVGPDYIDPMYHTAACGRSSRNLDAFMLPEDVLRYLFAKNSADADVAVVEGVMGLYDGLRPDGIEGSSAHVSQILQAPVVLLVNARGMSLSLAALINGFRDFALAKSGRPLAVAGVLLNNLKNEMSYQYAKQIVERECGLPVFGWLPNLPEAALSERHLGLLCSGEVGDLPQKLQMLAEQICAHCDLPALLAATQMQQPPARPEPPLPASLPERGCAPVRIGLARDAAFNFYYQDSLELLEQLGAQLVPFSPLADGALPPDLDGLLLGGGYPELHLPELSANQSLLADLRRQLAAGLPCLAECGGFIYLGRSMEMQGESWPLADVFPFDFEMTDRLQHFGYIEVELDQACLLCDGQPLRLRGHEFHYTQRKPNGAGADWPTFYQAKKPTGARSWREGWQIYNTLGGYPHFNLWAEPQAAVNFLLKAANYRQIKGKEATNAD